MRTVLDRLQEHARDRPDDPAYGERSSAGWRTVGWRAYCDQIDSFAASLIALGVEAQEVVCILGVNRPAWAIACLGSQTARAVPVGIYQTCSAEQVAYIAAHAEARVIVIDGLEQWRKIDARRDEMPGLRAVVAMPGVDVSNTTHDELLLSWDDFVAHGREVDDDTVAARRAAVTRDDLGSLIYTSGTTGRPKAVMLSHGNLVDTCRVGAVLHDLHPTDSLVSYLPLAHIAEQMLSIHMPAYIGYRIDFVDAPEDLLGALQERTPTVFFGVPRVWEKIHAGIAAKLQAASPAKRRLADWTLRVGRRRADALDRNDDPSLATGLQWALADRLVASKVRAALGLSRVRIAASGAAPLGRELVDFFAGLGVRVLEVYGLSECSGPATWNRHDLTRAGTVGPPIPEVEVRIAADGEVLLRGPNVFQGYFKDEGATAEALDDQGWLHTGDLGAIDEAGCLTIIGRKKEILITSGGKNIAPAGIEAKLKRIPLVGDALAIGDRRRFVGALLTLDEEGLGAFLAERGRESELGGAVDFSRDPEVLQAIRSGVEAVNESLARVETIRDFRVLPRRLSAERGELTPTLKPKRQVIEERWAEEIESMYS